MRRMFVFVLLAACGGDTNRHTRAFVAPTACGQGPYDIHFPADGKTGGDGISIVACTSRRISGHVSFEANRHPMTTRTFGDVADNQRCVGGAPTVIVASANGTGGGDATSGGPGSTSGAAPTLIERPYTGSETPFAEDLCKPYGLVAQEILGEMMVMRHEATDDYVPAGSDLHVRIWSDVPNDLDGVVFLIRHLTSKKTPKQEKTEFDHRDKSHDNDYVPPREPSHDHGPPPAPLVEERPQQPMATVWVPGYWSWTGSAWGWVAGFWRDDRVAMPAPRIEIPGEAPRSNAIWIGGTWTLRAGQYIWITGRWR